MVKVLGLKYKFSVRFVFVYQMMRHYPSIEVQINSLISPELQTRTTAHTHLPAKQNLNGASTSTALHFHTIEKQDP